MHSRISNCYFSFFRNNIREEGLKLLGWRDVEVDRNAIGEIAKGSEPLIKQVFIDKESYTTEEFERKLFIEEKSWNSS